MPNLKFLGVCLHELFDNGGHEIDITLLAALTAYHQLTEWEVGRYSIEMPTSRNSEHGMAQWQPLSGHDLTHQKSLKLTNF